MKLAAIYNTWDGDEILPYSIAQIQPHVDVIVIIYQNVSNFGESYRPTLPERGTINVQYHPDLTKSGTFNETRKRNLGLEVARAEQCTHFISMDCDELYDGLVFKKHRDIVEQYDGSACRMLTYYKHPNIRLSPLEDYYVPFISRIYPTTRLGSAGYPVLADPTRTVSTSKNFYIIDEPIMHHFSWVRADIARKLRNSSASGRWRAKIPEMVEQFNSFEETGQMAHFEQYHWVKVANVFDLPRFA
jgi:hypothetical protein